MEAERRENREYLVMIGEDEDVKSPRTLRALDRVKRSAKRVAADAAYQRAVETKMRSLMRAHDFDVENLTYSAEDASAASGWQLWDFGSHYSWRLGGTAHTDVVPDEDVPARHSY